MIVWPAIGRSAESTSRPESRIPRQHDPAEVGRGPDIRLPEGVIGTPEVLIGSEGESCPGVARRSHEKGQRVSFRHPLADAAVVVRLPLVIVRDDGYGTAGSARPVFECVRDTGRRLAPGHHDLAGVLESSLERDRREKGRLAPCLLADQVGERNLARFPGNELGMADPQRDKESRLGHLFGRKLDAESPLSVGPNDARAGPSRRRPRRRATDRTLQKDLGAPDRLAGLALNDLARECDVSTRTDVRCRRGRAGEQQASQHDRRPHDTDGGPARLGSQRFISAEIARAPDLCVPHGRSPAVAGSESRPISYTLQGAPTTRQSRRSMVGCHARIGMFSLPRRPQNLGLPDAEEWQVSVGQSVAELDNLSFEAGKTR